MKSPFEKYIGHIKELRKVAEDGGNESSAMAYNFCISLAEDFVAIERNAIVSAFMWGVVTKSQHINPITSGEEYYEKTFGATIGRENQPKTEVKQ